MVMVMRFDRLTLQLSPSSVRYHLVKLLHVGFIAIERCINDEHVSFVVIIVAALAGIRELYFHNSLPESCL